MDDHPDGVGATQTPPPTGEASSVVSGQTTNSTVPLRRYPDDDEAAVPYRDHPEGSYHDLAHGDDDPPPSYTVVDNEGPEDLDHRTVYYLDKRLDTDPTFLEQHVKDLAKEPPRPYVRIQGLHRESKKKSGKDREDKRVVDFDFHIDLTPLLYEEMATRRSWERLLAVNNFDKVRRGTVMTTRAPGFGGSGPPEDGTPSVTDWCERYCSSKAGLKAFVLERRITGWDFALVGSKLNNLVRATNYRGQLNITFPTTHARVELYNDCRTNRWRLTRWISMTFLLDLSLALYMALAREQDEVGTLRYACMSEDRWYRLWRRPIEQAVLARRQGRLSQDDIDDAYHAPGADDFARGVRAGLEVVQRTLGWGGDVDSA
ncbi:hypothetical protein CEP52_014346 [Fusarium oligoseptatum]|uniref:Uncharacterized protein n=1 Tax=Fusarium oligoseptatum TaxID=2604345 RepID=A0A428SMW2_9HYPO|nr:hypothetical protein CEP52_014346 [Fusarium oligoseptatum]